ncbi:[protein-PII] uridylyltransferase [Psychromonas sp. MME2]|uniref:[protein-PII] uridylyltransferase n=1 Tax=unclassified Psychromonas TaxID=2614957 RepID=UPI00339C496B
MDFETLSPANISDDKLTLSYLKNNLKQFQQWQIDCFKAQQDITEIVACRANYIDQLLIRLWDHFALNELYDLTLIAVGGYGRGELHPKSDIDILILFKEKLDKETENKISDFITLLWDLKLDIGHSVRSLKDCVEQGQADITVATSMIEARYIKGNQNVFDKLTELVENKNFWPSDRFFTVKREEQKTRHCNCRGDGYSLEPDIKNGCGGMRDIQTIAWIAKRHFNAQSLLELTSYDYITQGEYRELVDCQRQLWSIRFAIHTVTNRPDNRLLFDFQNDVATFLGYTGKFNQAIEQMMKAFYQTIRRVKELNEMLLQYFDEAILGSNIEKQSEQIDNHFQLRGDMIELTTPSLFNDQPESILQLFLHVAEDPRIKGIYSPTMRKLREARRCLTQWLQNIPECRTIFMRIIKHPKGMGRAFTLMYEHGVLAAYIPQWSRIVGQMQFDLFHAYTVDEHTHKLIENIYNYPESKEIHPLANEIYHYLEKPELLFLAAIFHDIAKGQKGDHSTLGAMDALAFCELHGLNRHESKFVAWLVAHHLIMSVTAQRRDISDPRVIVEFATVVRDEKQLNYLFCLTVADICATNEETWNSWKGTLLRDLYYSTLKMLRRGLENPPDIRDRIRDRKQKTLGLLATYGITEEEVKPLWKRFNLYYFFRYKSAQITWHTVNLLKHQDHSQPMVLISDQNERGATEVFVYHKDMPSLFSSVVTEIDNKKLSVHDAKILSSRDDFSLSTFTVLEQDGEHIDPDKIQRLKEAIEMALIAPEKVNMQQTRLARVKRKFKFEPEITFLPTRRKRTQIELVAFDAPGILANIGEVFRCSGLVLDTAKITTIGERAEDLFIVSTLDGNALTEEQEIRLKAQLIAELSPEI